MPGWEDYRDEAFDASGGGGILYNYIVMFALRVKDLKAKYDGTFRRGKAMSRIWEKLRVPLLAVCCVCFAVITALAALVPSVQASDGSGGYALSQSIAITAPSPHAAQSAFVQKAPAGLPARTS